MNNNKTIRAFFRAVKCDRAQPPYDTIHLKVIYPAQMSNSELEQDQGIVPADSEKAPFGVVIFFNGVNCGAEIYQWLAVKLAKRGLVVVTFNWVAENLPGIIALTPGVDISMWTQETYGTGATALALPALLAELQRLQTEGILAGMLDLEKVVLGGHSAGGRVALESADNRFFPQLAAAFGYGVHTSAPVQLGYAPGTILPLPSSLPMLLMGGTCDGVIANSSFRYGLTTKDATTSVIRTFKEAIASQRKDCYLVLLEGANHFSIADPFDFTTGRAFLDFPATQPEEAIRALMAEIIGLFIDAHVRHQPTALTALNQLLNSANSLIHDFDCK
ncbi:MAG: alpha/beta hydrolase family protein [Heteroscytonema crispum UTEX LB 1556]